jgi:hypothetical protein
MLQSSEYKRFLGYNAATKLYEHEYDLIDSDFRCVVVAITDPLAHAAGEAVEAPGSVIQEYSKRKLNVAANLVRCFKYQEKIYGWTIAQQIEWAEKWQPLFTPELKAELDKYLTLL